MRIVYFGSACFGIPCLDALLHSGHELAHVFTQPAHRAGRGQKPRPTDVAQWAEKNHVPCTEAEDINEPEMIKQVESCYAQLLVVIAFGQKIGPELVGWHKKGAINVHASLLPKYRGAAPINWAIINNEKVTGNSIITLADRMDAGFILGQDRVDIRKDDTAASVYRKLSTQAPLLLLEVIGQIENGRAVYTPQDNETATRAPKLKKTDGWLDFSKPADVVNNYIRGLWSWPEASADYYSTGTKKCYRVIIAKAEVVPNDNDPGTYGLLDEDMNVICGKDRLKLLKVKPAGGHLMDFQDFVNGRQSRPGDLFMPIEH